MLISPTHRECEALWVAPGSQDHMDLQPAPLAPVSTRQMTAGALHAPARLVSVARVGTLILQMSVGINMSSPFHPVWRKGVSQLFLLGSGSTADYSGRQLISNKVIVLSFKKEDKMFTFFFANYGIFLSLF